MAAKSPSDVKDLTLFLIVMVNGSVIPDYYPQLSVEVYHEFNKISYAELSFVNGAVDTGSFPINDREDFVPGNEIEILAGYGSDDKSSIFRGVVVKHSIEVNSENTFKLVVTCKHKAVVMTLDQRNAEYSAMTDSDIMSKVIKSNGLKAIISSTSVLQETLNQNGATDWDLVLSRAEFFGFLVSCINGDELKIGTPDVNGTPVLRLTLGESIINFQAELDAQHQSPKLEALKGNVSFQGSGLVIPGKLVELEGLGARYNGKAFVSSVIHTLIDGRWTTSAGFDPRYPVVLGALYRSTRYSSTRKPVNAAENNNNYLKSIITKDKLKISFDDKNKVTTISTPAGNSFSLDDDNKRIEIKDQHGNFMTMGINGITISSDKDISLTAKGGISMSANTKIDLSAKADLIFKGANISHTAQIDFTAIGTSSAQLSSSGQTVVRGTIVMIN
jgi:phage protein D